MVVDNTKVIGDGTLDYTLSGQVFTWDEPLRPPVGASYGFMVNIDRVENLVIASETVNAAGHILTTTVTGDLSLWVVSGGSKEGVVMMIDDNLPGGLFTSTTLADAVQVANTQYIWTPRVTNGQPYERSNTNVALEISATGSGAEWGCFAVGAIHQIIHVPPAADSVVRIVDANNCAVRDLWFSFAQGVGLQWLGNLDDADVFTLERCILQSYGMNVNGAVFVRDIGFVKNLTVNNTRFYGMAENGNTARCVIKLKGALAHTVTLNLCDFWRVGTLFRTEHATNVMSVAGSIVFANRSVAGAGATPTYTECVGTVTSAGQPAGVTVATEKECGLAYHHSPPGASKFPLDASAISSQGAAILDKVTPISGITEDRLGVVRTGAKWDAGSSQDFLGFGTLPETIPTAPQIVVP